MGLAERGGAGWRGAAPVGSGSAAGVAAPAGSVGGAADSRGTPWRASAPVGGCGPAAGAAGQAVEPRGDGRLVGVVFGALGVAAVAMLVLHLIGLGRLSPLSTTVSDYVSLPGGAVVLAVAVFALAAATAVLAVRLATTRPRAALLLGIGCAGLALTVAFPTNVLGTAATTATVLHRCAAALFFVSLPIASLATARAWTVAGIVVGALFLVSHVPLLWPHWPGSPVIAAVLPRGLAERCLIGTDVVLLARLAREVTG